MAFTFNGAGHRRDKLSTGTLPAIAEDCSDDDSAVYRPVRTPTRSAARQPWVRTLSASPLSYNSWSSDGSSVTGSGSSSETDKEKWRQLDAVRENKHIAKRGGWKRLAFMTVAATLCLVGFIAGLVVGLRNRNNNPDNTASNTPSNTSPNTSDNSSSPSVDTTFPAGWYAFETYLSTVDTNCTSNPDTWRCYPYTTYDVSSTLSAATFSWAIGPSSPATTPPSYVVSSTQNPFSVLFTNSPLILVDPDLPSEHYTFEIPMIFPVVPSSPLTSANIAATCYFNQTVLLASLYTKMAKNYPPSSSSTNNGSAGSTAQFVPWPYAVSIEQIATSGQDVPECFDMQGNRLGDFTARIGGECNCVYQNYGR